MILLSILLVAGIVGFVFYRRKKSREIKEWLWMGFGEDPFRKV